MVGRQIVCNSSKPPAGQHNDQNSDGQVQPCVTLRRKTVLQKLSLFLEPLPAHSPIQPFSVARWLCLYHWHSNTGNVTRESQTVADSRSHLSCYVLANRGGICQRRQRDSSLTGQSD